MEGSSEDTTFDPAPRTFSQVLFLDVPHLYPLAAPVTCCYTLTADFQPNPRDWVGIFKVGWCTTKDYHTFVWVEPCLDVEDQQSVTKQAVFTDYYLPKDEMEFYQFCYVDSGGQVRGASTPFCFKRSAEQSMESNPEDDLLVVTTQQQVEQSVREKAELQSELDHIMEENQSLKSALQLEQQETASLKAQNEQTEKEKKQLVEEMCDLKEQKANLQSNLEQQLKESEHLKEMLTQMTKQMETQEQNTAEQKKSSDEELRQREAHVQEKYERAVMKINQLKEERTALRAKAEAQSGEISALNSTIRQGERELLQMKDSLQLLQFDLRSSEKEKERLSAEVQRLQVLTHNMDDMKRESQELCSRLSQQEMQHNCENDNLRVQCETLAAQLQEAQVKLATESEPKHATERAELLERQLLLTKEELKAVIAKYEQEKTRSSKQELKLQEAHEVIADKDGVIEEKEHVLRLTRREMEELARENQKLVSAIEELRRVNTDLIAAPVDNVLPDAGSPAESDHDWQQLDTPDQPEIGVVPGPEEESLICRHCQEIFPDITQQELEQHEQSHRICPFCMMICDGMEQSVFEDHVYSH